MKHTPDEVIPCPYVPGAKFRLLVSPSSGTAYEADVTVLQIFTPFTISPVMKVFVELVISGTHAYLVQPPPVMVLKVYDRRFTPQLRKHYKGKLLTYGTEARYLEYVMSGKAPEGLEAIIAKRNEIYSRGIPDEPPVLREHLYATTLPIYYQNECAAYRQLSSIQGQMIPTFYGTTRFLTDPLPSGLDEHVPGILLEFVPGVNLSRIEPSAVDMDRLFLSATRIADECESLGVLNTDVRLENFIVKADKSGVTMIDFAQSRLRRSDESDEDWKVARWGEDAEGSIGYVAKDKFGWSYVPSFRYMVIVDDPYE